MMSAIDLWLNSSFTLSCEALFSVAFHQLSNTTSSVGHSRPSDFILRLLSGLNIETFLPSPHSISYVSVMAKIVLWSETISNVIPMASRSYVRAYSIRRVLTFASGSENVDAAYS